MIEFGADSLEGAAAQAQALIDSYAGRPDAPSSWLISDPQCANASGPYARPARRKRRSPSIRLADAVVVGKTPRSILALGDYLREFQALVDRHGYRTSLYGHFGDGCIHARINFDLRSSQA